MSEKGVAKLQSIVAYAFGVEEWAFGYRLMETFPIMLPGYACTSHKSQGSTYSNAYIAYDNIMSQKKVNIKEKVKSLYVACSRASNKIVVL